MAALTSIIAESGGDYTSLAAWEVDTQYNLVTAGAIEQAECTAFTDDAYLQIAGATTDEDNYRRVYAAPGAEAGMPWRDTGAFIISPEANGTIGTIQLHEPYVRIERIQIETNELNLGVSACVQWNRDHILVDGCHGRYTQESTSGRVLGFYGGNAFGDHGTVRNTACGNAINSSGTQNGGFAVRTADGNYTHFLNCLAYNCSPFGFRRYGSGSGRAVNCIAWNCATGFSEDSAGTFSTDSHNNASDDGTAFGPNSHLNISDPFEDSGSLDFHPTVKSILIGSGSDLSDDAEKPFFADFYAKQRKQRWDIGPIQTLRRTKYLGRR